MSSCALSVRILPAYSAPRLNAGICVLRIFITSPAVSLLFQSRCHSNMTCIHVTGFTPACVIGKNRFCLAAGKRVRQREASAGRYNGLTSGTEHDFFGNGNTKKSCSVVQSEIQLLRFPIARKPVGLKLFFSRYTHC